MDYNKALELEIFYIKKLRENGFPLVNTTDGGQGYRGKKSINHIRKMREARKGVVITDEWRKNMSLGAKGKVLSESHKQNISKSGKGRKVSFLTRKRISMAASRRSHTESTKQNRCKFNNKML